MTQTGLRLVRMSGYTAPELRLRRANTSVQRRLRRAHLREEERPAWYNSLVVNGLTPVGLHGDSLYARSFESIAVDFGVDEYACDIDSIEPPPSFDLTFLDFVEEPAPKAPRRTAAPRQNTDEARAVRRAQHDARRRRNERKADYRQQRRSFVPVDHFDDILAEHVALQ